MSDNVNAILNGLNDEQKKAVECVDGPVLIVAGAGSGKTRVLTSRIAYMLDRGVEPENIMALTFTKKAATEMQARIALMVGRKKAWKISMGTFHSVFVRFLREYADSIGFPSNFTIYDTSDSVSAIKTCIKELGLDEKVYKPKTVLSRISNAKNALVLPDKYRTNTAALTKDRAAKMTQICDIYSRYWIKCKTSGVMDFDDILLYMNILLRDNQTALAALSERFKYVLVDEYQDTNYSQYLIIRRLTNVHRNICVVGDDSQSIYSFRGARIENILNFRKDYSEAKIFRLEKNYRSTVNIVEAANSVIEKNEDRIPKKCVSEGEQGEKIRLIQSYTEQEEALLITSSIISRIASDKAMYQDFAILYRTNNQSRALEEGLRKRNILYKIYSGNAFYDRAEVKDTMSYFKLIVNVNDDEAFKRIVNKPARGIGDTTIAALENAARQLKTSIFKACFADNLELFGLKSPAIAKLKLFCEMISRHAAKSESEDAYTLGLSIINESGLYASFKQDTTVEGQARAASIDEVVNAVKQYVEDKEEDQRKEMEEEGLSTSSLSVVTMSQYLENTSLLSSVDIDEDEDASNKVTLMTVHASKGLEFPYVYISGAEENIFPSGGSYASPSEIEEERRLFYVALTRAKKAVTITFSETRMRNGKHENNSPSRFVFDINPYYISNPIKRRSSLDEGDFDPMDAVARNREVRSQYSQREGWARKQDESKRPSFTPKTPSAPKPIIQTPGTQTKVLVNTKTGVRTLVKVSASQASPSTVSEDFVPTPIDQLKVGDLIEHNKFGKGTILSLSGQAPDTKATIRFTACGEKIILLKFAKIRKISL
ncbi:MAG: UvrD-helicase domain-containing protein [Bacteroidales bacterium]|nr:UvrD-helicase domain-containing protein [Bacteroidales bacterium]